MTGGVLIDDRSDPPLRTVIGTLLQHATQADFAVANVRLVAIDLTSSELQRIQCCRLLLDRLDVEMLADVSDAIRTGGPLTRNLRELRLFAESGRLELRAAGPLRWSPDFSVMRGLPPSPLAPAGAACLVGAHYFSRPVMPGGVSFTCAITGPTAIDSAHRRFEELWGAGHDVLPVVRDLLDELLGDAE
jgi:hypothetical protein